MPLTVASMLISAAGNQVIEKSAGQNDQSQSICDKMYTGNAWSEHLLYVVEGVMCIQPKFDSQMLMALASMFITAAVNQVSQ